MRMTLQEVAFRKATELLNKGQPFNVFSLAEQVTDACSSQLDDEQKNEDLKTAEAVIVDAIKAFAVVESVK